MYPHVDFVLLNISDTTDSVLKSAETIWRLRRNLKSWKFAKKITLRRTMNISWIIDESQVILFLKGRIHSLSVLVRKHNEGTRFQPYEIWFVVNLTTINVLL
jgi:hypothetical protein